MTIRKLVIPGKPLGKQRPRVLKTGIAYTPKETVHYETFVKMLYLEKYAGVKPFEGPVAVEIVALYQIPRSARFPSLIGSLRTGSHHFVG